MNPRNVRLSAWHRTAWDDFRYELAPGEMRYSYHQEVYAA